MTERLWKRHHELAELDFPEALEMATESLKQRYIPGDRNVAAARELLSFLVDYIGQHGGFEHALQHAQYRHIADLAVFATNSTKTWHNLAWDDAYKDPSDSDLLRGPQQALLEIKSLVDRAADYAALMKSKVPGGKYLAANGPKRSLF